MTLKGKVLEISYMDSSWIVVVDGSRRSFPTIEKAEAWIRNIIVRARDRKKKAMLIEDVKHWLQDCEGGSNL